MAGTPSNAAREAIFKGDVNAASDTFKGVLMASGFSFNKDSHDKWADVSASELAGGAGYSSGGVALTGVSVVRNDTTDRCEFTCNTVQFTATTGGAGQIGPTPGLLIFDDTTTTAGNAGIEDVIMGFVGFDSEITQEAGGTLNIKNIQINL